MCYNSLCNEFLINATSLTAAVLFKLGLMNKTQLAVNEYQGKYPSCLKVRIGCVGPASGWRNNITA